MAMGPNIAASPGLRGCGLSGKDDCYACLRGDNHLKDAIAQIEARLKR